MYIRIIIVIVLLLSVAAAGEDALTFKTDPVTRYVHVSYTVPADAPDEVVAVCAWAPQGTQDWKPARVQPLVSETGLNLATAEQWQEWAQGRVPERRAKGLVRTVVFNPYPDAQTAGKTDIVFRVEIKAAGAEAVIAKGEVRVQADNADVFVIEDWSKAVQQDLLSTDKEPKDRKWQVRAGVGDVSFGNDLSGASSAEVPLSPLTYPLDLRGQYAIFACTIPGNGARIRLTGDERRDMVWSRHANEEVFWRWAKMDRQHLVVRQPHNYSGYSAAEIDYVKFVPLTPELAKGLEDAFGEPDKIVGGYFEPYSWAFVEDVADTAQHREPLAAFKEARMTIIDIQIARFGAKSVYESRSTDQLLYATIGDPVEGDAAPKTNNTGRMQQYTNTLETELRYAREMAMQPHANFGATNCYVGSPLQGDFSKAHPDWMAGNALRYDVPEVRAYMLGMVREALEIGAPGISIDFCRYPEGVNSAETGNTFIKALHDLANEYGAKQNLHIPILVRFPGTKVRRYEFFDYATWAKEGWVDYLCPSNIQGRHHHIDAVPYIEAVKGTQCKVLPCIDGLGWGPAMPGPFLWRVAQVYKAGVDGLYVYQADEKILGWPANRRYMKMLCSSKAVQQWWDTDAALRPARSKGIYLSKPEAPGGVWNGWERLRLWTEGVELGPMEIILDDKPVNTCPAPPYLVGTEDYESDGVIPPGDHTLKVRVKDGEGWLEQSFAIKGAG